MIKEISDTSYLGNSLEIINANMNEFNVRIDQLYSDKAKWDSLFTELLNAKSDLENMAITIQANERKWNDIAFFVYKLQQFWAEPIKLVYDKTFTYASNYFEIENWLNLNFPAAQFSDKQVMRCEFSCKNYNENAVDVIKTIYTDNVTLIASASKYGTNPSKIYKFLSLRNQLRGIINLMNVLITKNNKASLYHISGIEDLSKYETYISYDYGMDVFYSTQFDSFSQKDLKQMHCFITQYTSVYETYLKHVITNVPEDVLAKFSYKDVYIANGGAFFFKKINNRWSYFPYTISYKHSEYCESQLCSDGCYHPYGIFDINDIYKYKDTVNRQISYVLKEVCGPDEVEALSMPSEYEIISDLIS